MRLNEIELDLEFSIDSFIYSYDYIINWNSNFQKYIKLFKKN